MYFRWLMQGKAARKKTAEAKPDWDLDCPRAELAWEPTMCTLLELKRKLGLTAAEFQKLRQGIKESVCRPSGAQVEGLVQRWPAYVNPKMCGDVFGDA